MNQKKNISMILLALVMALSLSLGLATMSPPPSANAITATKIDGKISVPTTKDNATGAYSIVVFDYSVDKIKPNDTNTITSYSENSSFITNVSGFSYQTGDFNNSFSNNGILFQSYNAPTTSFIKVSIPDNYTLTVDFKLKGSSKYTLVHNTTASITDAVEIHKTTGSTQLTPVSYTTTDKDTYLFTTVGTPAINYLKLTITPNPGESGGDSSSSSSSSSSTSTSTSPSTSTSASVSTTPSTSSSSSSASQSSSTEPTPVTEYTVTLNNNGNKTTEKVKEGESIILPSPTRDGYDFRGWNTKQDGSGTNYNAGATYAPKADTTLYAIWEEQATETYDYYVKFMDGDKEYQKVGVKKNGTVSRPADPTPKGDSLRFGGWYKDNKKSTFGNKFNFDEDAITKDITLYALWIDPVNTDSFNAYIDYIVANTPDPSTGGDPLWAKEGFKGEINYIDGVFFTGLMNLYHKTTDQTKKDEYKKFFLNYVGYFVNDDDGSLVGGTSETLDFICETKVFFDAYELSGNEKYMKAIEKNFTLLTNMSKVNSTKQIDDDGKEYKNFAHQSSGTYSDQVWLDGMYMYAPFYARYLATNGESTDHTFHELRMHYQFIRKNMRADNGLYYHAYTTRSGYQWADPENHCSHNFWLRSIGWLTMSLVEVIEYFPEGEDKEYLISMFQELSKSLLKFKDRDTDMYYQLVNYDSSLTATKNGKVYQNYLETSGSSMIAYAMLKGARLGYLPQNYRDEGKKTFEGIYNHSFDTTNPNDPNIYDICKMGCLNPTGAKDGSIGYYLYGESVVSNDGKGLGPFILAYTEYVEYSNEEPIAAPTNNYKKGKTFSTPETPDANYKFIGWTLDKGKNLYKANATVEVDGIYTAIFAKAEFKGGSIKTSGTTGVKFAFEVSLYNITDKDTLTNVIRHMSGEFVLKASKENKVGIQKCMIDDGAIVMELVAAKNFDAATSTSDQKRCEQNLEISINLTINDTAVSTKGTRSIQQIAREAYNAGYIDKTQAKSYGYAAK